MDSVNTKMSTTEEATVNADGTTTFESAPPVVDEEAFNNATAEDFTEDAEEIFEEVVVKGIDPAIYLIIIVLVIGIVYFFVSRRNRKEEDDFFSELDGEKFNLTLPSEVEEYYQIKAKAEAAGWEPGKVRFFAYFIPTHTHTHAHVPLFRPHTYSILPCTVFFFVLCMGIGPKSKRCPKS